jgi:flagellar protein FlaI
VIYSVSDMSEDTTAGTGEGPAEGVTTGGAVDGASTSETSRVREGTSGLPEGVDPAAGGLAEPALEERPDPESVRAAVLGDVTAYYERADPDPAFAAYPEAAFVEESFFEFDYLEGLVEIERAWVNEPYAYVSILYDADEREYRYHVSEPVLDSFEQYVREDLVEFLRNSLMYEEIAEESDKRQVFEARTKALIRDHAATVDDGSLWKVLYYLRRDFLELGPIDALMRDPAIEDVSCDGTGIPVYVYHRSYRDLRTNVSFGRQALDSFVVRLAQRAGEQVTVSNPLLDASLPDGSRLQLTLGGEVSTRGPNFTVRKFAEEPFTPIDLIRWNTFSVEEMVYFWLAIESNKSLVFAGGTGSGKTTSMNAVSMFIPHGSKIVTIEDTREIDLPHENWIAGVTRDSAAGDGRGEVSMYHLLQSALRQRPEYIVVGEIRTEPRVALTFFQAMGTGHTCYTTMHADSIESVINRLQNPPLDVPMGMIQDLDVISVQRQLFQGDGRVRRNERVTELINRGDDPDEVRTIDVFRRDPATDEHRDTGDSELLRGIAADRGWGTAELNGELRDRQRLLQYLVDQEISDFRSVASVLKLYQRDPEYVVEQLDAEEPSLGVVAR